LGFCRTLSVNLTFKGVSADKGDPWDRMTIATFPVKLVEQLMDLYSNPYDMTLDPFAGSGTVMSVAQKLERNNISIEINSEFCQIIMSRCFDKNPQNKYDFITSTKNMEGEK
jgi:DNA modification methylase